ncbi:hypothetical protein [Lacrimispora amygdalina]|uniref:hypothetical protein n=1 Tax=Lacrimispora amygdalina TaxID=253257 RepID=UPI000BE2B7E7|nr:hypothetical protein [Lacrimispora amygdalina]
MKSINENIVAYPIWINIQKEVTIIDIPDFEIHIEEENECFGKAMIIARNYIKQKLEQIRDDGLNLPDPGSVEYKKAKGFSFTYVDVDIENLFNAEKSLEELVREDFSRVSSIWDGSENNIEFYKGQKVMSVTFSQIRLSNKIQKLAGKYPDEVKIVKQNQDGSVYAKLPVNYLHIYRPGSGPKKEYTEEEKAAFRERITKNSEE